MREIDGQIAFLALEMFQRERGSVLTFCYFRRPFGLVVVTLL